MLGSGQSGERFLTFEESQSGEMQKNPEPKYPVGYNYRKGEKFRFIGFESDFPGNTGLSDE